MINVKTNKAFVINKSKIRTGFRRSSTSAEVLCMSKLVTNIVEMLIVNKQANMRSTTIV